ncbi:MAG: UbiD family decarboxylase [Pirellulales bacterium]|nr:UbiD family decarboxylase [Pirellulales bacterium]
MGYRSLRACVDDLAATGRLVRIDDEIDPRLEAAEIQRRVYQAGGPAILFNRLRGCRFPAVSNLFGTRERTHFIFRDTLGRVRKLVQLKIDPAQAAKAPWRHAGALRAAWHMLPRSTRRGPVLECETTLAELPPIVAWPRDGGPFITLPQVYTEDPDQPGWQRSNLGMYRIQLAGNRYEANREVGLHYQIHRGIGVHHAAAVRRGERLPVSVFVGGPPAMTVAAVMPLPEGLSELSFAGALAGRSIRLVRSPGEAAIAADADFCLTGYIDPQRTLPEGPFGDHLGYYSLVHEFPVMRVHRVYHRRDAVWPFTVVGRPPQEDTSFGELIHEITGPVIPTVIAGVRAVNAVDAAGVHPLLLAIGSERYVPYHRPPRPQELLTQANAILGQGQMSLAKYLLIVAGDDDPRLDIHDLPAFFSHLLRRIDWRRDVHFQTRTTIDTLDYSGSGFNEGSKVVWAAAGPVVRELPGSIVGDLRLPEGFARPRVCLPGVLAVEAPRFAVAAPGSDAAAARFTAHVRDDDAIQQFPLVVLVDDSEFTARTVSNFLWVTFTRSNPAADIAGCGEFVEQKHWGCRGPLVIDARIKPHHAPPLVEDPAVTARVDQLAARGGPLHGIL